MITSVTAAIGTIAFVIQKMMEFLKPVLEKYIPWFDFSDIKKTQGKIRLLDKIYDNTLQSTKAENIEIDKDDFKFNDKMTSLIDLRVKLVKKVSSRNDSKALRYMILGVVLGIVVCLLISKLTGLTFFGLGKQYETFQASKMYWIIDSVIAGIIVGFGSKPVHDVLNYFNNNKKGTTV